MFICIASGYFIGLFLYISLSRLTFPITIDWVEGPVLVQVNRLLLGQKIYIEPTASYVPLVYQPLFFYIAAGLAKLIGFSLAPTRLLSILSSCGSILLIFLITRKAAGSSFPGVVSAGLFAATNGIVWTWFDFGKVDMLFVFFSLLGLYFLIQVNVQGTLLAGFFFTLSFFTKQSALIIILPASIFYVLVNRKLALLFIASISVLIPAGILLQNYDSNGWYYFYAFVLPSYHRLDASFGQIAYVVTSILKPVVPFIGIVLISILADWKKYLHNRLNIFLFGLGACTLVLAIISALGVGTTRNAFIPAYALISIVFGIGFQSAKQEIDTFLSGNLQFISYVLLFGICILQFSLLQYNPREYIPSSQDFKRANVLIKNLEDTDGEFILPSQNYLALYVHKTVYYHDAPMGELTGWYGKSLPQWLGIQKEIKALVQSGQVSTVYMTEPFHDWLNMRCEKEETLRSQSKFVPNLYKMKCY
jgi:hypothetical protein